MPSASNLPRICFQLIYKRQVRAENRELYSAWAKGALDAALRDLLSKPVVDRKGLQTSAPDQIRSLVVLLETGETWAQIFALDISSLINTALGQIKYVDFPIFWNLVWSKHKALAVTIPRALQSMLPVFREGSVDCGSQIFDLALKYSQFACLEEFGNILSSSPAESPFLTK